jgi:hypothetical protein
MDQTRLACLGFVYVFSTGVEKLYKLGFTESALSGRGRNHSFKLGKVQIEAVAMTLDSRLQEGVLFAEALKLCDRVKTYSARKQFNACELFYLNHDALHQVKDYLRIEIGQNPFSASTPASEARNFAIRKAKAFNEHLKDYELDCAELDSGLRKFKKMVEDSMIDRVSDDFATTN